MMERARVPDGRSRCIVWQGLAGLVVSLCACNDAGNLNRVSRQVTADTVVVTTRSSARSLMAARIVVVWQDSSLEWPHSMTFDGEQIVAIADRHAVHFLDLSTGEQRSVGREGAGPGEFQSIQWLTFADDGALVAHDPSLGRLTFLSPSGEVVRVKQFSDGADVAYVPSTNVVYWAGGVLMQTTEMGRARGIPMPTITGHALRWFDVDADTGSVLDRWPIGEGEVMASFDGGRAWSPRQLFGPRLIVALGAGPRHASGYGTVYCIDVRSIASGAVQRVCRDGLQVRVGSGIRQPDHDLLRDNDRAVIREQAVPEYLPSYDRLLLGHDGSLWVRTLGTEMAGLHPRVLANHPDRGPKERAWDVFDTEGRLACTIWIPMAYQPRVVSLQRVIGFVEMESGEVAIGVIEIDSLPERACSGS